ncbi:MAG: CusA/CzcA family heavy metal efflux RND transporter, partial [Proteobacteria bacterium]|nr:CusA/CzcA family heavy metal efflux RND transporter [Pseudomonadota bacterium]
MPTQDYWATITQKRYHLNLHPAILNRKEQDMVITTLINKALGNRVLVIGATLLICLLAGWSIRTMTIDAIPDLGDNQQIIVTEWPGHPPMDLENLVTYPLSSELSSLKGVSVVRSLSGFGISYIYVIFQDGEDFYESRTRITEKLLSLADKLPDSVKPTLGPDANGLGQIFWYTINNQAEAENPLSLADLRSLQDFHIRPVLQSVMGVSEVASVGGHKMAYHINLDPEKLRLLGISSSAIIKALRSSNRDVGAATMAVGGHEWLIRGRGFFQSLDDIRRLVVQSQDNQVIRVGDVADVVLGPEIRQGVLDDGGKEVVGGVVAMRFGENPRDVIQRVKTKINTIQESLPPGVELVPFYSRLELIERTTATIVSAMSQQILITALVILLFLVHIPTALLVSLSLPLALAVSFIFMRLLQIPAHVMSLAGLVISLGNMVDMSIIMTENIYAKLARLPADKVTKSIQGQLGRYFTCLSQAAQEVGPAIFTAVLTTLMTFLPVFLLEGREGKLFTPLAWTKSLAMLSSLAIALLVLPAMASFFLRRKLKDTSQSPLTKILYFVYERVLRFFLGHRMLFCATILAILGLGAFSLQHIQQEFMPALNEGELLYMPVTSSVVNISQAKKMLSATHRRLEIHPLVAQAVGKLGRVDSALDPAPIEMFETIVKLVPKQEWPPRMDIYDIMAQLDQHMQIPGLINSWDFPIQTRLAMIATGIKTEVGIKIFGSDYTELEKLSGQISQVVSNIEGASFVFSDGTSKKTYLEFDIDYEKAVRFGVTAGDITQALQSAVRGEEVGEFIQGRERYPIRVRYHYDLRSHQNDLAHVLVPSQKGGVVPLSEVTQARLVEGPTVVTSEDGLMKKTVQLSVRGRDVRSFIAEAKQNIDQDVLLPAGYFIEWSGEYQHQLRAYRRLMILIPLVILINLLIIFSHTRSWSSSVTILSGIPVAFSGGLILLWLVGMPFSVAVWVGFIALFGFAVDDGVILMTYLKDSYRKQQPKNQQQLTEMVVGAGLRRIRPLFMTTATTMIALLPVLQSDSPGSEMIKPIAVPVFGGMMVEWLTLFVVPVAYSIIEGAKLKGA